MDAATMTEPRSIEAMPVTLARIEGTVNLVAHDVAGLAARVGRTEIEVRSLQVLTQRLDLDAEARDRLVIATALVIKTEKDTAAEALATEKTAADGTWTPFARFGAVTAVLTAIASLYLQTRP